MYQSPGMFIAQYLATDPEAVAAVLAVAELLQLDYRVSGSVVAVMVPAEHVDVLRRAVMRPGIVAAFCLL